MLAIDVTVIVSAMREDASDHQAMKAWLEAAVADPEPVGISDVVLTGVARILTHRRIFDPPTPTDRAVEQLTALREADGVVRLVPGPRHWGIFGQLVAQAQARGNLLADAAHAAIAIEHGATLISKDGGFARFAGLRWRRPLDV